MNASTTPTFQLFWLRESGVDMGTHVAADELPAVIRDRVVELAGSDQLVQLRLPYVDRLQERRLEKTLEGVGFERNLNLIRAVLDPAEATRDMAAACVMADPIWRAVPGERDPEYFMTWQRVSLRLQRFLRNAVAEAYFADLARLEDRPECYPVIVYQAARLYYGHPRSDFAYDLRDFPWCKDTLEASWKLTGRHLQRVMTGLERRLRDSGNDALARRYSPVWHQDVLVAVQRKPRAYADLLARESAILNALIDLGTQRTAAAIHRSAGILNRQLRSMYGMDLRPLGCSLFEEATRELIEMRHGPVQHLPGIRPDEDHDMVAAGSPDARVRA